MKCEKKKKGSAFRFFKSLQFYFICVAFVIITISVVISGAAYTLLDVFLPISGLRVPATVWITLFSIVLGLTFSAVFSKLILKPIRRLITGTKQVAEGDFTVRLKESSRLEDMQELYTNFNLMVEELGNTDTLRSDFVTNVSHEFKTPINAIEGYATLLQDRSLSESERDECVHKIIFNTKRLSNLVGNMLIISKLESQTIPESRKLYRLDEQIRRSILDLESRWEPKNIEFDIELENVTYNGIEPVMGHVWTNLIDNAIKHSDEGGEIKLRLYERDNSAVFTIEDKGDGMTEEVMAHIFEKFYQGDTSHKAEGNGLGLALCKKIVDMSGGEIHAESTAGVGSKFTVELPLMKN